MDEIVREGIVQILGNHRRLLMIPLRQKAKFEGWLKFELAQYLEEVGMKNVEVESKRWFRRDRTDITFFRDEAPYSVELKTANTNWKTTGVNSKGRPITNNIQMIVDDAVKLNSPSGVVAFVLFPVPIGDRRWESYLDRIGQKTGIALSRERNCRLVTVGIDAEHECDLVVCAFMSKRFSNWP